MSGGCDDSLLSNDLIKMQKSHSKILARRNIFVAAFIFIYIFVPLVLLPFNVMHILAAISLLFLCTRYQEKLPEILSNRVLRVFLVLHFAMGIYVFLLSALTSGDFSALYYALVTVFEILPCAIFISVVLLDRRIDLSQFYDIILGVGLMQVLLVALTWLMPGLREWVISSSGSAGLEEVYQVVREYRIYGIARSYTFAMPLFQGVCIIIALTLGAYRSPKYYLLVPFFFISIVLNARIGLIALFVGPAVIMCFKFWKTPLRQVLNLLVFGVVLYLGILFIQYKSEDGSSLGSVFDWLNTGVEEVTSLLIEKEARGNLEVLKSMWILPSGMDFLFGTGQNIFGREGDSSDIGYVINLYYGGLIFSLLLYLAYFILIMAFYKGGSVVEKNISICLLVYLAIANVKGNVFIPSELINGIVLLIVFSIISNSYKLKSASRVETLLTSPHAR